MVEQPAEDGAPGESDGADDEAHDHQKSYRTILEQEILAGLRELHRPAIGLFLSSLSAGLDIGFSVLLIGILRTLLPGPLTPLGEALQASLYSVGFVLVLLGRSELFTEHTTLAVLPLLRRRSSAREVARVWGVVFAGNALGAAIFAGLATSLAPALEMVEPGTFARLAQELDRHPWPARLGSAVLAGWLMGELGWIIAAARDTISQVVFVWLVTAVIGFAHLHHVVVGMVEMFAGAFEGALGPGRVLAFIALTALGNAIGGVVFVAILKYGHASHSVDASA